MSNNNNYNLSFKKPNKQVKHMKMKTFEVFFYTEL